MNKLCMIILFLNILYNGYSQSNTDSLVSKEPPFTFVELMPSFIGGQEAMYKFISEHIVYPHVARENNIQGVVVTQFTVDIDSLVKNIKIIRGIGGGCDQEVLRIMQLMNQPKHWIPGMHTGRHVPVTFTLPVTFKLQGKEKKKKKRL